jgi:UDP-N-acetylmuramoylalanine--D-glutamate ligase
MELAVAGKRVLVVGAARSGIAAAKFLHARGGHVTLADTRPMEELAEAQTLGVQIEAGGHHRRTFLDQDLIVASPGVPWNIEHLTAAREAGILVVGEAELASRFLKGKLVGITGSNGKTTTTALTGKLFEAAGFHTQVGGNIGTPLISLVDTSGPETINVVELSSFQLEGIHELRADIAMVLNITPDHLDRHGDFIGYAKAKARIMENQKPDDIVILNADDETCRAFAMAAKSRVLLFSRLKELAAGAWLEGEDIVFSAGEYSYTVMGAETIPLKGAHNVENVLAALCAVLSLNPDPIVARKAVQDFKGVEHRLEFVAKLGEVEFYNDSKATNVDATIKALEAFETSQAKKGKLLVILGGKDKGSDYTPLKTLLKQKARAVFLIGTATEKIATHLGEIVPLVRAGTLDVAVREAARRAKGGDTVLLAPACASFDQFKNFEHRGQVFKELVKGLQH